MTETEQIILVNEQDQVIGSAEKYLVHQQALLHRAFSVFIFKKEAEQPELLLQKRHPLKYHSGDLWTNTCCGHPRPNEEIVQAGQRRLKEEMGIDASLKEIGKFHYKVDFDNGLTENEIDHVLIGFLEKEQPINFNGQEISDFCWMDMQQLQKDLQKHPNQYTRWLSEALNFILKWQSK